MNLDQLIDSVLQDSGRSTTSTAEDAPASADSGSGFPLWREPGPPGCGCRTFARCLHCIEADGKTAAR